MDVLFLLHVSATAVMTGIIWFVQVIHYPWFHEVPHEKFVAYHHKYTAVMGMIVGPPMLVEALTGVLLWRSGPGMQGQAAFIVSLVLLALIWLSTALLQVPCHQRLAHGYDPAIHHRLVKSNWIRTAAWTGRLVLLLSGSFKG